FSASVQSALQLAAAPEMRGRILSLYQIVYMGTTPLGSLLVGWLAEAVGPRSGLVLGSVAALGAGALGLRRAQAPLTRVSVDAPSQLSESAAAASARPASSATAFNAGRNTDSSVAMSTRDACADMFRAATVRPRPSTMGTATERTPTSRSWSTIAKPLSR